MSQGEQSCKVFGNCTNFTEVEKCNKECDFYSPKLGEELSEEVEAQVKAAMEQEKPEVRLEHSTLPKFDKAHEFFVMKKHVFTIQSVSPKKIILKYNQKLKDSDGLGEGCYVFRDQEDKLLDPHKTFIKFKRNAKAKKEAELEKRATATSEDTEKEK